MSAVEDKFDQYRNPWRFIVWLFGKRIWCGHSNGRFVKKVGAMSMFYCPDCDDHYFIQREHFED